MQGFAAIQMVGNAVVLSLQRADPFLQKGEAMTKKTLRVNWPQFRGRFLTLKEMSHGQIIVPAYTSQNFKTGDRAELWRSQFWIGRTGAVYFQLGLWTHPLSQRGGKSTLDPAAVARLDAEVRDIHAPHIAQVLRDNEEELARAGMI